MTWAAPSFDFQRDHFNRFDTQITARKAKSWHRVWSYAAPVSRNACGPFTDAPPITGAGKVYYNSNGYLLAVNAATGRLVWKQTEATGRDSDVVQRQAPTLYNGLVYDEYVNCNSESSPGFYIVAYDAATGKKKHTYPGGVDAPVLAYGKLFVRIDLNEGDDGPDGLTAFDVATGSQLWQISGSDQVPLFANKNILYTENEALNPNSGHTLWTAPDGYGGLHNADVSSGRVYGGHYDQTSGTRTAAALNGLTGEPIWSDAPSDQVNSWPTDYYIGGSSLYGQIDGHVAKIDASTGARIPLRAPYGCNFAPQAVVNGVVIGTTQGCGTVAVNAANGQYLSTLIPTNSAPAIAGDRVYVVSGKKLLALKATGR
jgi:hypothetical protein